MSTGKRKVTFITFFMVWAIRQKWDVPPLHAIICRWLDETRDPSRVLLVFRGAAKSTIFAIYKAYELYQNPQLRNLIWAADGKLATKLSRDALHVLRRHPLCAGMLPKKPGQKLFWVNGSNDARNASVEAVGVDSNATGGRADCIDFDDIEVPNNIKTPDARINLRNKVEESTHILVPGGQKTYIGTPHTHDSIYKEQIEGGAAVLKIPLFEHVKRYDDTGSKTRYTFDFVPGKDGLYVMAGIGKFARMMVEKIDYRIEGKAVVFKEPPGAVIDICAVCAWPERFDRKAIEIKRQNTRTLNGWDSQYLLESKPINETRLDPSKIIPYDAEPTIRHANNAASMYLGSARIVGMAARWDPSGGKINSDASSVALMLQDEYGRRYWHRAIRLSGEIAEFTDDGKTIIGGQVWQLCDLVEKFVVPRVTIETNGIGGFAPAVLKAAIKQRRLHCAVKDEPAIANKNKRILEAFEPLISSAMLWAHTSVLDGPAWDQMKDFNPAVRDQPDDDIDAAAGAIVEQPERIRANVIAKSEPARDNWQPMSGVYDVEVEY